MCVLPLDWREVQLPLTEDPGLNSAGAGPTPFFRNRSEVRLAALPVCDTVADPGCDPGCNPTEAPDMGREMAEGGLGEDCWERDDLGRGEEEVGLEAGVEDLGVGLGEREAMGLGTAEVGLEAGEDDLEAAGCEREDVGLGAVEVGRETAEVGLVEGTVANSCPTVASGSEPT